LLQVERVMTVPARSLSAARPAMTKSQMRALYAEALPDWATAPTDRRNRRLRCPLHDDHRPSLLVNEDQLTWYCFPCGRGGGAWDLAVEVLGHQGARDAIAGSGKLLGAPHRIRPRRMGSAATPCLPNHEVEDLGPLPDEWVAALMRDGRLLAPGVLVVAGVRRVRARF
jgi:hypothetical protein